MAAAGARSEVTASEPVSLTARRPWRVRPVVSLVVAAYLMLAALPPLQFAYQLLFLLAPLVMVVLDLTVGVAKQHDEE